VTGARTLVVGQSSGAGPSFYSLVGIARDEANGRMLVMDTNLQAVLSVDLVTGDRFVVSGGGIGGGPIDLGGRIAVDSLRRRVLTGTDDEVLAISIADESNHLVSSQYRGRHGPEAMMSVVLAPNGSEAYHMVGYELGSNYGTLPARIELASGDRADAPLPQVSSGLYSPRSIAYDAEGERLFALQRTCFLGCSPALIVEAELTSGAQRVLASNYGGANVGSGPLEGPNDIAWDAAGGRLLTVDENVVALIAIDPVSLVRTVVSGGPTGTGDPLESPYGVLVDASRNRALVFDLDGVIAISLDDGSRTLLSSLDDQGPGNGPAFMQPLSMALDTERDRVIVLDFGASALMAFDLETGDRELVTELEQELPATLALLLFGARSLAYDSSLEIAYLTANGAGLLAIDARTGQSLLVSGSSIRPPE
jgi:hypothetical protein